MPACMCPLWWMTQHQQQHTTIICALSLSTSPPQHSMHHACGLGIVDEYSYIFCGETGIVVSSIGTRGGGGGALPAGRASRDRRPPRAGRRRSFRTWRLLLFLLERSYRAHAQYRVPGARADLLKNNNICMGHGSSCWKNCTTPAANVSKDGEKSYNHGRMIYFEHEAGDAIMHAWLG
jgi:hypothetical protein